MSPNDKSSWLLSFSISSFNMITATSFLHLLSFLSATIFLFRVGSSSPTTAQELLKGFTVTPDSSVSSFQPLLTDSNSNYSLGLLRVNQSQLSLAVLHLQSSQTLWTAAATGLVPWSGSTKIFFNGSIVISGPHSRVFWSSHIDGDRVWLSNTSNLQIQKTSIVVWQSFDFPSDTLVENQNFTSAMTLISSNGLYSMQLGSDFIGLYANFDQQPGPDQIYFKHKAMEIKAKIIEGQGPIYAAVSSDGFLGMYQNGSVPLDIEPFSSFQQFSTGRRRLKLEPDGNLKSYYWTGSNWALDYQAISESCDLPSSCGSYGMCHAEQGCSCLNNETDYYSGRCESPENNSGDFCKLRNSKFKVLRRSGIELPYKQLMEYEKMRSLDQCERSCENDCKCWGAVYSNSSGFCYTIKYPIQTLVAVGDDTKVGYFKVRESAGKSKIGVGLGVGAALICGAVLVLGVVIWGLRRKKNRKRGIRAAYVEDGGVGVGPYKDLASASFSSIELSQRT